MNFVAGAVVGNNAILKLSQTGSADHFKVFSTSNVHLVADIVGYYLKPVATALQCVDTTPVMVSINLGPSVGFYSAFAIANACAAGYI